MSEGTEKKPNSTNIIDDDKNTQLHYAAASDDEEEISKQIALGHKVDAENYLRWTPLMVAVRNGRENIVKHLIENHKADVTKKNKFGMSVFLISISSGNLEIVRFILQHLLCGGISRQTIQKIFSPISVAILFNQVDIVKYLVSMSFDVNCAVPVTGITPLMIAAAMEFKETYAYLLQNGADPNKKNVLGHTADMQEESRKPKSKEPVCMPRLPILIVNSQPYIHFQSPQPSSNQPRKSSNTISPSYPPNVTPITPVGFCPQYFFPPDFSPRPSFVAMSPVPNMSPMMANYSNPNDFMNVRINETVFLSPVPPQNFPSSPCA